MPCAVITIPNMLFQLCNERINYLCIRLNSTCTSCISYLCVALPILQISHGEHRALFRSSLDRFHVTKILLPLSTTQTIRYAQFSGLGLALSRPLNTQLFKFVEKTSMYLLNQGFPNSSMVLILLNYPLLIVLFTDNGSCSGP